MGNYLKLEKEKCLSSLGYGISKYLKTYDRAIGEFTPFVLYPKQKELINLHKTHKHNLIYKSRQVGGSSLLAAMAAMKMASSTYSNPEAIISIHIKQDMGYEFIQLVRNYLNQLPREFWGEDYVGSEKNLNKKIFIKDTKNSLTLPNGSSIKSVGLSVDSMRGFTPSWVIIDEAAFMKKGVITFWSLLVSVCAGGSMTMISTPNGYDELFHGTYMGAIRGNNGFNVSRIMWYEVPRLNQDLTWIKGDDEIIETEFTVESYRLKEMAGYKPTSSWYRSICGSLRDELSISQELDAKFIETV